MDTNPRIAIDAMGGDTGPVAMVAGAARARRREQSLRFLIFGDEALVGPEIERHAGLAKAVELIHTPESIAPTEKPSVTTTSTSPLLSRSPSVKPSNRSGR